MCAQLCATPHSNKAKMVLCVHCQAPLPPPLPSLPLWVKDVAQVRSGHRLLFNQWHSALLISCMIHTWVSAIVCINATSHAAS